jgi:hypothetical protein
VGNAVNDKFSSLKVKPAPKVCLYEHANYGGWEKCFSSDQANFVSLGINDVVSSVKIFGGAKAELYEHVNYGGFKQVYTNNVPWVGNAVNDKFSSLKVIK